MDLRKKPCIEGGGGGRSSLRKVKTPCMTGGGRAARERKRKVANLKMFAPNGHFSSSVHRAQGSLDPSGLDPSGQAPGTFRHAWVIFRRTSVTHWRAAVFYLAHASLLASGGPPLPRASGNPLACCWLTPLPPPSFKCK